MEKIWRIAEHQFTQEVLKRGFLIALLSLPAFLAVSIGMGFVASRLDRGTTILGYVDEAGLIVRTAPAPEKHEVRLVRYETPGAAHSALEAGQIDAYYVLAADYRASRQAELVYFERPAWRASRYFHNTVRVNLMADQSSEVVERVLAGAEITVHAMDRNREFPDAGPRPSDFVPLISAALFAFLVLTVSGTLMDAVATEKQNRTMEVVVTSVSPGKMMAGKVIGVLGMALVLLVGWGAFFAAAGWIGGSVLDIGWMQDLQPRWRDIWMIAGVGVASFLFVAAFMIMLGVTVVEGQEIEQAGPLMFVVLFLPIYFVIPILQNPNGALAIAGSLIPATAVSTLALRSVVMEVPTVHVVASAVVSFVSGVIMVGLAGKAFRLSMLRYGQGLRLRELFAR